MMGAKKMVRASLGCPRRTLILPGMFIRKGSVQGAWEPRVVVPPSVERMVPNPIK